MVVELTKFADVVCDGLDAESAVVDSLVNAVLDVFVTSELAGADEVASAVAAVDTTAGTVVESLERATVVGVVSEIMARVLVSTADADVVASIAVVVVSCCVVVPAVLVLSPPPPSA